MRQEKTFLTDSLRASLMKGRGALLSLLIVATISFGAGHATAAQEIASKSNVSPSPAVNSAGVAIVTSYADIVSRVAPAVVTIHTEKRVRASQQFPFMDDPALRELFGDRQPRGQQQQPRSERQNALGSGVIVSADGYILTNHHVVDGAEQITVDLSDDRTLTAKLVGSDQASDLAVLKINASGLPVLPLGDSDRVRVGDVVLAVGNPLGIGQTVTSGIISAKGRQTGLSDGSFEDFLQTDAAINRGNSGGALVNTNGELVGINSQILSPSGGSIGIGFSIPANMARDVMAQLIKNGKVRRGLLGVTIQPLTADLAASLGLQQTRGALVGSVQPGSPAERAGVRRGDVITAFNGSPVADNNVLRNGIARTPPGSEVTFTVVRDNREQQLRATLGELPVQDAKTDEQTGPEGDGTTENGKLGVSVEPLTPDAAAKLQVPRETQGLVVTNVDPDGPAADAGIRQGDLIQEVNRQPIRSIADLRSAIGRAGTRPLLLLVTRGGNTVYLTARLRQ
ncbi:MAG: DegQ family serine endoprotease [Pyrinomonadaceae bacterium]